MPKKAVPARQKLIVPARLPSLDPGEDFGLRLNHARFAALGTSYGIWVDTIRTPEFVNDGKLRSRTRHFKKEFPVPACLALFAESPNLFKETSPEKRRGLNEEYGAVDTSID